MGKRNALLRRVASIFRPEFGFRSTTFGRTKAWKDPMHDVSYWKSVVNRRHLSIMRKASFVCHSVAITKIVDRPSHAMSTSNLRLLRYDLARHNSPLPSKSNRSIPHPAFVRVSRHKSREHVSCNGSGRGR